MSYLLKYFNLIKFLQINRTLNQIRLDKDKLLRVGNIFRSEMAAALAAKPSSLQMENTYIPELPNGTGTFNQYIY